MHDTLSYLDPIFKFFPDEFPPNNIFLEDLIPGRRQRMRIIEILNGDPGQPVTISINKKIFLPA